MARTPRQQPVQHLQRTLLKPSPRLIVDIGVRKVVLHEIPAVDILPCHSTRALAKRRTSSRREERSSLLALSSVKVAFPAVDPDKF